MDKAKWVRDMTDPWGTPARVAGRRYFVVPARGMALSQVKREPSDNISMKRHVTNFCDEFRMGYSVKAFRPVNCHCHCPEREVEVPVATL